MRTTPLGAGSNGRDDPNSPANETWPEALDRTGADFLGVGLAFDAFMETGPDGEAANGQIPRGAGAASLSEFIDKVVNSDMGHASARGVLRAGYATQADARSALQAFGRQLEEGGTLPERAIFDPSHSDRVIVPGFGNGGAVVYQVVIKGERAVYRLKTVVNWREPEY